LPMHDHHRHDANRQSHLPARPSDLLNIPTTQATAMKRQSYSLKK